MHEKMGLFRKTTYKIINQLDFSSLLFDTLFGLVLFYGFDSLLNVKGIMNFVFYLFSTFIVIHWWLMFKSVDDIFDEEVSNSVVDLIIGIIEVILLDYVVVVSRSAAFSNAIFYLLAVFIVDMGWAILWRFVGEWDTRDHNKIQLMEKRLNSNILINMLIISLLLLLIALKNWLDISAFVYIYMAIYGIYIVSTFASKLLNIDIL